MEDFSVFFIALVIMFGVIAVIVMITKYFDKKRTEALENVAEKLQMSFRAKDNNNTFRESLAYLPLMTKGSNYSKKASNLFIGPETGFSVSIFDYQYTVGSGKNSSTYSQTVAAFKSDDFKLPTFSMYPERFFHKIGTALGMQDIDFEDYPQFSKQYLLKGDNEATIRNYFNSTLLDFFTEHSGWHIEGTRQTLLIYRSNKKVSPEDMENFMKEVLNVAYIFQSVSV